MGLAEERGLGMKSLRERPTRLGLPLPRYSFEDPYLSLALYRRPESASAILPPWILGSFKKDELAGWQFLASRTGTTRAAYVDHTGFEDRKAQRHLKRFVELGLLERHGKGPATEYRVLEP